MTALPTGEQILTIQSDRTLDGVYVPTVSLDDRHLLTLDRDRALRYVAAWADAAAHAEYDAAVFAQLTGIGLDEQIAAATIIHDLRPDRAPLDDAATAPLRLEPIMSTRTKRGQVAVHLGDEQLLQLDAPDVYDHIAKVLLVVMTCDLDGAYRRYAIAQLEQPVWRAEAMVHDLGVRWRLPETTGSEHDKWIGGQFAGIVAASTQPAQPAAPRPPQRGNRGKARKKKR